MGRYESGDAPDRGIVYKGDGHLTGTGGFVGREREHARAEVGYVLNRVYQGRGLAAEALRAMISFGFARVSPNRIEARCIAKNAASARVMGRKAGMTHEGTPRQREFLKGAYQDTQLHALLKGEHPRRAFHGPARRSDGRTERVLTNVSRHVPRGSFKAPVSSLGPYGRSRR